MFLRESGYYKTGYRADMALFPHPAARRAVQAALFLLFVPAPLFGSEHLLAVLTLNAINLVGALGLTILLGYAGQISLGHGAFMSVGAYTAANLAVRLDLPFWLTLPAGAAMAALAGILVGLPSLRIRGFYLAIATLAAQLVIEWIINRTPAISGGIQASIPVPRPDLFGIRLDSAAELYLFVMVVAAAGLLAALNLGRSRLGRAMVAVREHETAAGLMGVDVRRVKLAAFAPLGGLWRRRGRVVHLLSGRRQLPAIHLRDFHLLPRRQHHRRARQRVGRAAGPRLSQPRAALRLPRHEHGRLLVRGTSPIWRRPWPRSGR